jgi:hypothetical protein
MKMMKTGDRTPPSEGSRGARSNQDCWVHASLRADVAAMVTNTALHERLAWVWNDVGVAGVRTS